MFTLTISNSIRWLMATAISLLLAYNGAWAQATNATIAGVVSDENGQTLPGATVLVKNEGTGFSAGTVTNANGEYIFRQLPLGGPYTINVSYVGYGEQKNSGYQISQGTRLNVNFKLSQSNSELQEILVKGNNITNQVDALGEKTSINSQQLKFLPTEGRNFSRLVSLSPLQGGGSINLGGARRTSTGVTIDGVNARNMLTAGELGRGPYTISQEAIREFEVNTNDYDVTSGRFGGGSIQAVTKGGTNEFEASAFVFHRNDALQSDFDIRGNEREADFNTTQSGISIGGPIIKDKLHFYAVYERQDQQTFRDIGFLPNDVAENQLRISRDSLNEFVRIARESYGLSDEPQTGQFERKTIANTFFLRLDWQINEKHRLTLRNNFNDWQSPLNTSDNSNLELRESWSDFFSRENSTLLSLRSTFSPKVTNEFKIQYQHAERDFRPSEFLPLQNIPRAVVFVESTTPDGRTSNRSIQIGGQRFTPETNLENQVQFTNTTYLSLGKFNLTFGTDNQITYLETLLSSEQNGRFTFQSLDDFRNLNPNRYLREAPIGDRPIVEQTVADLSLFAQVDFNPHPDLNIIAGLRWDATVFFDEAEFNPLVEQELGIRTDEKIRDFDNIQPRLQLTWNVRGNDQDIIKLGAGFFSAQPHYYAQVNNIQNSGTLIQSVDVSGDLVPTPNFPGYRADPNTAPGVEVNIANGIQPFATINAVAPNFEVPLTFKANFSYTRFIGTRYKIGFNALYSRTNNNYVYQETNLVDEPFFRDGLTGREVFVPANSIGSNGVTDWTLSRKSDLVGRTLVLSPDAELETMALIVEGSARLGKDGELSASFTFNQAKDNNSYNCCVANTSTFEHVDGDPRDLKKGFSNNHFSHKLVVNGFSPTLSLGKVVELNWGVTMTGVGGEVFSFRNETNTSINGDFNLSNDQAYIFDPNDPNTPEEIAQSYRDILADPEVTDNYKDYLRDSFGGFAERNGGRNEFWATVDLRWLTKVNLPNTKHSSNLFSRLIQLYELLE